MFKCKRWLGLVLCLVMSISMMLPVSAVDPLSTGFASFLIHANTTDSPEVNLHIKLYRRGSSGLFLADDAVRYDCRVNRAAGDPAFYIQPKADGVWVEVDYLTDLNGDGIYEMLDGEDRPVCDTMTATGELTAWTGTNATLKAGQTYLLTAKTLAQRGQEVLKARNTAGSGQTLPEAGAASPSAEGILYFVSLHYNSPTDKQEYVLSYYVRLYDSVIVPSDVPATAWYYGAVEYALEQGFFSGAGSDAFLPNGSVTRAQLAQILWRMGGSVQADKSAHFSDVSSGDWCYQAVNWCSQEGLMSGSGNKFLPNTPLTREQLALVLQQYAKRQGLDVAEGKSLSGFADGAGVSEWGRTAMEWAVSTGLLSGYENNTLRPINGIKRCELAAVLRTFCQTMLEPAQET